MKLIEQETLGDKVIYTNPETPNYRYVAYPDVVNNDLTDYLYLDVGVFGYYHPYRDEQIVCQTGEIGDTLTELLKRFYDSPLPVLDSALTKALYLAGYDYRLAKLVGYSQGEWQYVVLFMKKAEDSERMLRNAATNLNAWFRGDLFCVGRERLTTWVSDKGDEKISWEFEDGVGGYLITCDFPITEAFEASGIVIEGGDEE